MKSLLSCLAVFLLAGLAGCSQPQVETSKPLPEITQQAAQMSVAKLQAHAQVYQAAIDAKTQEIATLKVKLDQIPLTQMLGDEAKVLRKDIDNFVGQLKALQDRLNIFVGELKRHGVDTSAYPGK